MRRDQVVFERRGHVDLDRGHHDREGGREDKERGRKDRGRGREVKRAGNGGGDLRVKLDFKRNSEGDKK